MRFFFHLHDGKVLPDTEGTELPDIAAARKQAAQFVGRLLADRAEEFWDAGKWTLEVKDEHDELRLVLEFSAREVGA